MPKCDPSQSQGMAGRSNIRSFFLYFFLSFLLSLTSFYLLTVSVEGNCCVCSHSHIHSAGLLWRRDRPVTQNSTSKTQNSQQTSMTLAGFELAVPASERPQAYASHLGGYRDRRLTHHDRKSSMSSEFCVDR